MSGAAEAGTLATLDAEIARLVNARDEHLRLVQDPEQREARGKRREQLVGRWVVRRCRLSATQLRAIGTLAGEEAWLFEAELMEADGWLQDSGGNWGLKKAERLPSVQT